MAKHILLITKRSRDYLNLKYELAKSDIHLTVDAKREYHTLDFSGFLLTVVDGLEDTGFGEEVVRIIRRYASIPIFYLSRESSTETILRLFELGITQVIDFSKDDRIIYATIKALALSYRDVKNVYTNNQIRIGPLLFDFKQKKLYRSGLEVSLTPKEFKVLDYMCKYPHEVISKERLIYNVWPREDSATENAVTILMSRLRRKLKINEKDSLIETVWGFGYRVILDD